MPNKSALRIVGLLFCSSGVIALAAPMIVSIAVELIAGWLFTFIGTIQIIAAAQSVHRPVVRGTLGLGVVSLLLGVVLIAAPAAGVQTLTLLVALIFMLSGALKFALGRYLSRPAGNHILLMSGLVSVSLGSLIALTLPQSATVTLGLMLGAELLSHGIAALVIASTAPD
ncbi:HdeD family acid-resistance protein [Donghicola sp. XS_ASV15]|uniref:HdeD family acid-resistance protein n=1 Tax=Donghicola sp. XS_ASV15 TaxID=3241295 RepID=UPI0035114D4A